MSVQLVMQSAHPHVNDVFVALLKVCHCHGVRPTLKYFCQAFSHSLQAQAPPLQHRSGLFVRATTCNLHYPPL